MGNMMAFSLFFEMTNHESSAKLTELSIMKIISDNRPNTKHEYFSVHSSILAFSLILSQNNFKHVSTCWQV